MMNNSSRTVLWVVFSLALLFLWDNWQRAHGHPSMFGQGLFGLSAPAQAPAAADAATTPATAASNGVPAVGPAAGNEVPASRTANLVSTAAPLRVSTDVLTLDFDLQGAQIVRATLRQHADSEHRAQSIVLLDTRPPRTYLAQTGWVGAQAELPTHRTMFQALPGPRQLADGERVLPVTFVAESGGLEVRKTYRLRQGSYAIEVSHEIRNVGTTPLSPALYLQLVRDGAKPLGESRFYSTYTGPVIYTPTDKFQKVSFSSIEKNQAEHARTANAGWFGMIQHYFVAAWILPPGPMRQFDTVKLDNNLYAVRSVSAATELAPGASRRIDATLYIGPQDQAVLAQLAPGLDLTVDYGWLTIIAKPLFALLGWLHAHLGNWGWAIVVLTVLVKAVFYPLSATSYRSMARMKKMTPRLQALRTQHGDDRQKMQLAMMELYRTEKINPFGGCLPILVQVPVFIALYWVLLASVEMRGAPWIGWVHDLSTPDPWFVLPAIMMATMYLQAQLNPKPPDPMQARIMMFMPLVFGGMMFFFPAGLVLYWVVNNMLSIAQQWYINRQLDKAGLR